MVENSDLYNLMMQSREVAYLHHEALQKELNFALHKIDPKGQFNVFIDDMGYIRVRSSVLLEERYEDICEEFGFYLAWFKEEIMNDYRNVEEVDVTIYEYGFGVEKSD